MKVENPLVFAIEPYRYLQEDICAHGGFERGHVDTSRFPDGEMYQRLDSDVADRHVAIVGGSVDDRCTLELYDLACAVVKYGAQSLTLVMPYFGYSTMERATKSGEVVKAKTRARLLSSIPGADAGNRVLLLDLHSEGIPHYFESAIRPVHVRAYDWVAQTVRELAGEDCVLACTDAGRAKWVEALANRIGVMGAFVFKRRLSGDRTEVAGVSAEVNGRNVVIYDDMIRTGGSLCNAAKAYRDAGAERLWAIATHGILPANAVERLRDSGLFDRVVVTDSYPYAKELAGADTNRDGFLRVDSVAPLLTPHVGSAS